MDYDINKLGDWISVDQLDMSYLSSNPNPEAMRILMRNPHKIYWFWLARNPCLEAMNIVKKNMNKRN